MFDHREIKIDNSLTGYINEREFNRTKPPSEAVVGVLNRRFLPEGSEIRPPYMLWEDLSSVLPTGYTVLRFCEKVFIDHEGTAQVVMIAACKNTGAKTSRLRFYVNHYYLPELNYRNCWKAGTTTRGWISGWVNLNERYNGKAGTSQEEKILNLEYKEAGFLPPPVPSSSDRYHLRSTSSILNKHQDYFKGWYFVDENGDIMGLITGSVFYQSKAYFKLAKSTGAAISETGGTWGIARFAVTETELDNWQSVEDVRFFTYGVNSVKIFSKLAGGGSMRTLNLNFVKDRKFINPYTFGSLSFNNTHNAWITSKEGDAQGDGAVTQIKIKVVEALYTSLPSSKLILSWKNNLMADYQQIVDTGVKLGNTYFGERREIGSGLILNFNCRLTGDASRNVFTGDECTINVVDSERQVKYNGFDFSYDSPEILNKKLYSLLRTDINDQTTQDEELKFIGFNELGRELGIRYRVQGYKVLTGATGEYKEKYYSFAVELDGRQAYFVKNIYTKVRNIPSNGVWIGQMTADLVLEPWFSPRLTAHLLFFKEGADEEYIEPQLPDTEMPTGNLLQGDAKGYLQVDKFGSETGEAGDIKCRVITARFGDDRHFPEKYATGMTLLDYLHNYYWKTVTIGGENAVPAGQNTVIIRLNDKDIAKDLDSGGSFAGKFSICVSQVQQGNQNTPSVMCSERVQQLTLGQEVIGGAGAIGTQFILFTRNETRWEEITDENSLTLRNIGTYHDDGIVNADAVVTAIEPEEAQGGPPTSPYTSKFSGVFCAGYRSFYAFYGNKRVDLLIISEEQSRWRREYQAMNDAVKEASRVGYNSNNKEVFWYLNGKIYVWSVQFGHWTIYEFGDAVTNFVQSLTGELYFNAGNKIYKTEPVGTEEWKDKGTVVIPWSEQILITNGDLSIKKIVDGFDLNYEAEPGDTLEAQETSALIEVGMDGSNNDLFNKSVALLTATEPDKDSERRGIDLRTRCGFYKFRISSSAFKKFNLKQNKQRFVVVQEGELNKQ